MASNHDSSATETSPLYNFVCNFFGFKHLYNAGVQHGQSLALENPWTSRWRAHQDREGALARRPDSDAAEPRDESGQRYADWAMGAGGHDADGGDGEDEWMKLVRDELARAHRRQMQIWNVMRERAGGHEIAGEDGRRDEWDKRWQNMIDSHINSPLEQSWDRHSRPQATDDRPDADGRLDEPNRETPISILVDRVRHLQSKLTTPPWQLTWDDVMAEVDGIKVDMRDAWFAYQEQIKKLDQAAPERRVQSNAAVQAVDSADNKLQQLSAKPAAQEVQQPLDPTTSHDPWHDLRHAWPHTFTATSSSTQMTIEHTAQGYTKRTITSSTDKDGMRTTTVVTRTMPDGQTETSESTQFFPADARLVQSRITDVTEPTREAVQDTLADAWRAAQEPELTSAAAAPERKQPPLATRGGWFWSSGRS